MPRALEDRWDFERRRAWFKSSDWRATKPGTGLPYLSGKRYTCPCCGYPALTEPSAGYEICWLCGWEDDGQDGPAADQVWGGPNKGSLTTARRTFEERLTMYAESHERFPESDEALRAKRDAIAAFVSLRDAATPEDLHAFWMSVDLADQAWHAELSRRIADFEAQQ